MRASVCLSVCLSLYSMTGVGLTYTSVLGPWPWELLCSVSLLPSLMCLGTMLDSIPYAFTWKLRSPLGGSKHHRGVSH